MKYIVCMVLAAQNLQCQLIWNVGSSLKLLLVKTVFKQNIVDLIAISTKMVIESILIIAE